MIELKPCPFCGGEAKLMGGKLVVYPECDSNGAYVGADFECTPAYVECQNCHALSADFCTDDNDIDNAVEAWNRRANNGTVC